MSYHKNVMAIRINNDPFDIKDIKDLIFLWPEIEFPD